VIDALFILAAARNLGSYGSNSSQNARIGANDRPKERMETAAIKTDAA
jgi:hypothetical protein